MQWSHVRRARLGEPGFRNGSGLRRRGSSDGEQMLRLAAAMSDQAAALQELAKGVAALAEQTCEMNLLLTSEALLGAEERRDQDPDPFRPMSNKR